MADTCNMDATDNTHTTSSGVRIRPNSDRTVTIFAPGTGIKDYGHTIRLTDTEYRELITHGYIALTVGDHTYPKAE